MSSCAYIYQCILFVLMYQWTPKNDWKHFMLSSFFPQCSQVWFVFIKTEHFQSFKKRPSTSIFDDCRPKFTFYFLIVIGVVINAQPSFTGICEAWITKNDCRHFFHSSFFAKCFQFRFSYNKKMAFCKLYGLRDLWMRCMWSKLCTCICECSHKHVPDHNGNLQKTDHRK